MSKFFKKALISSLTVSLLGVALGCGSTSSNDQGVSLQNIGYYHLPSDELPPPGETGATISLFTDAGLGFDGLQWPTAMGIFNRLQDQFVRVVRIDCRYEVPGASPSLVIPDDAQNVSFVVNPSVLSPDNPLGEVFQGNEEAFPTIVYAGFNIVSPDLYAFLNANQASLPQLPFRMTALCKAVGVTQAGDTLETNESPYQIQFIDESECCTGSPSDPSAPGFVQGTGTGGSTAGSVVTGSSGATGSETAASTTEETVTTN